MRNACFSLITAMALGFSGTAVQAQSLEDLLEMASRNNLELRAIDTEYLSMLEQAPQVSQLPDPEVSLGVFVRSPETRVGPQIARLGVSQMFPWKGTRDARKDVALARAAVRHEQIDVARRELHFMVKQAYYRLYELDHSQRIIRRSLRIYESLINYTLARVENGRGSAADVLRVQLKQQELEQELALLENRKSAALARINQALNRPLDTPVAVADSLVLPEERFTIDTVAAHIARTHPSIQMMNRQQQVAEREMSLNNLSGKPSFGVGLDYILVNQRKDVEIPQNGKNIIMPMARMNVPLNRTRYRAREKEEQLKIEALEVRKQDMQLAFQREIEIARTEMREAALRIALIGELQRTTQTTIDILESQYSATGNGFDEILRLQNELVAYDLKILGAIVRSHLAQASIERFVNY